MAMDELRQRVADELAQRPGLTANAVSERARIAGPSLSRFLKEPEKTLEPENLTRLADFFHWPEEAVFQWAGLLRPKHGNPLEEIKTALYRGGWDPGTCHFVLEMLSRTLPGVDAIAQAQ